MIRQGITILLLLLITVGGLRAAYAKVTGVRIKVDDISWALRHPNATYNEKMAFQYGMDYRFVLFLKNSTPYAAIIALPPNDTPYALMLGNSNLAGPFLYPRRVILGEPGTLPAGECVTHVALAKGWVPESLKASVRNSELKPGRYAIWDVAARQIIPFNP
jgi:hypothetical protein